MLSAAAYWSKTCKIHSIECQEPTSTQDSLIVISAVNLGAACDAFGEAAVRLEGVVEKAAALLTGNAAGRAELDAWRMARIMDSAGAISTTGAAPLTRFAAKCGKLSTSLHLLSALGPGRLASILALSQCLLLVCPPYLLSAPVCQHRRRSWLRRCSLATSRSLPTKRIACASVVQIGCTWMSWYSALLCFNE